MRKKVASALFDRAGYVPLKEYVADIENMRRYGPWRLPIGTGDRLHLLFLSFVAKFSWFADTLYIRHPHPWSPAYAILISYLERRGIIDLARKRDSHYSGYSFFSLQKNITINERIRVVSGLGVDQDIASALSKAMGEMLERIISGLYNKDADILIASADALKERSAIFYPPTYHRFLPLQQERYRELQYHPANPIDWMSGTNLVTREKTYLPRHVVSWFGFAEARVFKDILLHPTSNGCAGYFTRRGAVLRGLLEAVQRDAFLVHWLTRIAPERISQDTLPPDIQSMLREFEARGISLHLLDVTALGIPSVSIAAINAASETPQIILSGASATTFEQALRDALREMVLMSAYMFYEGGVQRTKSEAVLVEPMPFVSDLNEHTRQLYWRGPEKIKQFQWFLSGAPVTYTELCQRDLTQATDDATQLKVCLETLKQRGPDYYPIAYFPKHPIQAKLGFFIAQVYIPKAFPLYLLECQGTFDSDRLQEFAESKGVREWKLNPLPHMFS